MYDVILETDFLALFIDRLIDWLIDWLIDLVQHSKVVLHQILAM